MKVYLYFMLVMVSVLGLQSCGSEIDGEWVCTEAKADGKSMDELSDNQKDFVEKSVGVTLKIDGSEIVRRQKIGEMIMYNRGTVELSEDKKYLTITFKEIGSPKLPWKKLPKELVIPIKEEVQITDKNMVIRGTSDNLYRIGLVETYTKK